MLVVATILGLAASIALIGNPASIMLKLNLLYSAVTFVLLLVPSNAAEFTSEPTSTKLDESRTERKN